MAVATLLTPNIDAGARLVSELDARGIPPETAAWIFDSDRAGWRLLLQFDESHQIVPTLLKIAEIINARPDFDQYLWMGDITIARPGEDIVLALKSIVHTGPGTILPTRFGPAMVKGIYFEQGLSYRAFDRSILPVGT